MNHSREKTVSTPTVMILERISERISKKKTHQRRFSCRWGRVETQTHKLVPHSNRKGLPAKEFLAGSEMISQASSPFELSIPVVSTQSSSSDDRKIMQGTSPLLVKLQLPRCPAGSAAGYLKIHMRPQNFASHREESRSPLLTACASH